MGVQALEATSRAEYVVKRLGGDLARASASVAVSSAFHPSMLKDERFCKIRGRDGPTILFLPQNDGAQPSITHPDHAFSDGKQMVAPENFGRQHSKRKPVFLPQR